MSHLPINLAVEDALSEAVLRRLLADSGRGFRIGTAYRRGGFGYLRRTIAGWNRAAKGVPFIVLTDLDDVECPLALMNEWLPVPKHPNLIFRIAIREVESWLLSDAENFARYIGCPIHRIPDDPDSLADPKRVLVEIAKRSKFSAIRSRIAPRPGSTAKQGPDYNACLCEFVFGQWNITNAALKSRSLAKAVKCFGTFEPTWPDSARD